MESGRQWRVMEPKRIRMFDLNSRSSRGLTLIEMLVGIAIVALLAGLTAGAISGARNASRRIAIEATTRQHLVVLGMYLQDFNDVHPWLGQPVKGKLALKLPSGDSFSVYYFETSSAWPIAASSYYDDVWPHRSHTYPRRHLGMSLYLYSCAMIADPTFWNPRTRVGSEQWRPTRSSEVRYPSQKSMLTSAVDGEPYPPWVKVALTMGMCDGSTRSVPKRELAAPVETGDGAEPGLFHIRGYHGMHTLDGVHGIDVTR